MRFSTYLMTTLGFASIAGAVGAQTAPFRPLGANAAAQMRSPAQLSLPLQAQVRQPLKNWKVDETVLKLAPQYVANQIVAAINQKFAGKSVGYSVTVIMPGGASAEANGGAARRAPDTAPRGWTGNDRITIASVSKTITGTALVNSANQKKISLDTKAWTLLPASWTYADSFKTISLRELLQHNSGIRACNIDYAALKQCAAAGVNMGDKSPTIGIWDKYSNANFAFMRLILPRMEYGPATDSSTPMQYGGAFTMVGNKYALSPSGVGNESCAPPANNPALSYISTKDDMVWNSAAAQNYDWTSVQPGQPWGSMVEVCGSQGWNLSSRQLATFINALIFTDKIMPQPQVQVMRDQGLGLMYYDFGNGLSAFGHGGYHPAPNNRGEINTLMLGFNNGVSVGVIINSRYKGNFGSDIAEAIRANVK